MRARLTRLVALAVAASLATASPALARGAAPLTDRYCEAVTEFYTVSIVVEFTAALADAFSQLPGVESDENDDETASTTTTTEPVTAEEIRATFLVVFSPKMEELTRRLAGGGPKVLRPLFRRQRAAFSRGVELLEEAGLTRDQIELIANAEVSPATNEVEDLSDDVDLDDDKARELGRQFIDELDKVGFEDVTSRQERELERIGVECGAFPDSNINCDEVLSQADAEAILGGEATRDGDRCEYEGPEPFEGQRSTIAIVVYGSARAFDTLTESVPDAEDVSNLWSENPAVAFDGYSADGHGITCGRTLVAATRKGSAPTEDRTVVVALCRGDNAEVIDDQLLTQIAASTLNRIAAAG